MRAEATLGKLPKLTKKQKESNKRYSRIIKISDELLELHFGNLKDVKCERCNKKIKIKQDLECRKIWKKGFNIKGVSFHDSALHFGTIPKLFNSSKPYVLCKDCRYDIYRFMGKIPDIIDSTTFPQHLFSANSPDELFRSIRKQKGEIKYKKKEYPYTAKKLETLRKEAVKSYLKKYPYVKYTIAELLAICKSHKKNDIVGVFH